MQYYIVITGIRNDLYMTRVLAPSACSAEHFILDKGICGKHGYGVDTAMAYDEETMKTDTFAFSAIRADPISLSELSEIIEANNAWIKAKDEAEDKVREIEAQMKKLSEELEKAKKTLAA